MRLMATPTIPPECATALTRGSTCGPAPAVGSRRRTSYLAPARTAIVLPTSTSPLMTLSSDSEQKRMRATACWWPAGSQDCDAGMVSLNGARASDTFRPAELPTRASGLI